ncbi:MAG: undecaprenyl/decaprenyl-phosphate alpha-N-acetylglucosaminyl 1-phosphate transferase, partial [Treponema sp.]|nr:undecaprenyl/decaprenyl-phosphate alpha-N-acetylglucosaminyl 1-phosphate transferase [Treponema sp.]
RRIDSPDMFHIHHKLKNLGLSDRGIDGILYGVQLLLSILVFFAVKMEGSRSLILLGAAYFAGICFFALIHYLNRRILKNLQPC